MRSNEAARLKERDEKRTKDYADQQQSVAGVPKAEYEEKFGVQAGSGFGTNKRQGCQSCGRVRGTLVKANDPNGNPIWVHKPGGCDELKRMEAKTIKQQEAEAEVRRERLAREAKEMDGK